MLAKASMHKGGRPSKNQSQRATSFPATLKELEINKSQSERWQSIATLPEKDFEAYIQEHKEVSLEGRNDA